MSSAVMPASCEGGSVLALAMVSTARGIQLGLHLFRVAMS